MRRVARSVSVGNVKIGGDAPVVIQSMTNTSTTDVSATLCQIRALKKAGCELVRVAIPDKNALQPFEELVKLSPIPLIADIHFNYKLALEAITRGAAKVRFNPGNIGDEEKVTSILEAAGSRKIPVRIGVNAGSLEKEFLEERDRAKALVKSSLKWIAFAEKNGFYNLVLSVKASDVYTTVRAYRLLAQETDHPFHIGVTEAGSGLSGIVKSAAGIGSLLLDGIGDTIRVSLTANPVEEISVAKEILQSTGRRYFYPELVSCPTCGRCQINLIPLVEKVRELIKDLNKGCKIAVMGCAVNGPGEARDADLGITGGRGEGVIFKKGKVICKLPQRELLERLKEEINKLHAEGC